MATIGYRPIRDTGGKCESLTLLAKAPSDLGNIYTHSCTSLSANIRQSVSSGRLFRALVPHPLIRGAGSKLIGRKPGPDTNISPDRLSLSTAQPGASVTETNTSGCPNGHSRHPNDWLPAAKACERARACTFPPRVCAHAT